jgi:hypothetical protein
MLCFLDIRIPDDRQTPEHNNSEHSYCVKNFLTYILFELLFERCISLQILSDNAHSIVTITKQGTHKIRLCLVHCLQTRPLFVRSAVVYTRKACFNVEEDTFQATSNILPPKEI